MTVVVLAYLINVVLVDNVVANNQPIEPIWMLSFLAGVVPTIVLQRVGCWPRRWAGASPRRVDFGDAFARAFATARPLTQIDGVDLQEASRLESEGIPDVASLARSDLVSVMINTRLPIERLVDWTDQAVLMLLLDTGNSDAPDGRLKALRRHGLRTASSVLELASATGPAVSGTATPAEADGGAQTEPRRAVAQACLNHVAAQGGHRPRQGRRPGDPGAAR